MTAAYPGPGNVFLISHEATQNLIITYSRSPAEFALPEYVQYVPVTKITGAYLRITAEEAARITNADLGNMIWEDGHEAPMHNEGGETHDWDTYLCKRYVDGFNLGDLTVEQATWDIMANHADVSAQKMMTGRSSLVHTALQLSGNWDAAHTATATTWGGGLWDAGTVDNPYILKSLNAAKIRILKSTLGVVRSKDLQLVVNPDQARQMSESQEIRNYLQQSPAAMAQIRGDTPSQNGKFGLPDTLYDTKIVVEDAVIITSPRGAATKVDTFVHHATEAYLLARKGGVEGKYGSPRFSTITLFMKEEMTVESKRDDDNRRTKGRIVENYGVEMTSSISGVRFTSVITP